MDKLPIAPLLILFVVILGTAAVISGLARGRGALPLAVRAVPLMTQIERQALSYIETALPWARVHAQVSMGALLSPKKGLKRSQAATIRNRFSSKRVDYVVEDRATGRIVMLIELDDRSHSARADAKRDRMTAAAGYFTLRLPAAEKPTQESVRRHIGNVFAANPELNIGANPAPV